MVSYADWRGFRNFIEIFTKDDYFYNSLRRTFVYVIIGVPIKLAFAFFIAMLLNMKLKGINVFRTVYYLPSIVGSSVAISILWRLLFAKDGAINKITSLVGIPAINWLGDPKIALFSISLIIVWQFGSSMVLFLAGLKQIPQELYEAARVDGAGKISGFFAITLPLITPILFFNLIMQMINAFQDFNGAMIVTRGGPINSTYLYALMLYDQGFKNFRMGYASALS
jgi:oligogalacturonide transport system permease protein